MASLPAGMHAPIHRYKRWQDRQAALLGRLLVRAGLELERHPASTLENWRVGPFGKPAVAQDIFFNLSHTDGLVVCAVTRSGEIGIDCEKVRPIDLNDFVRLFSSESWQAIETAPDRLRAFFDAWTQREAVLKADGCGLSLPMERLRMAGNQAFLADAAESWSMLPVEVPIGYVCHLAIRTASESHLPIIRHAAADFSI
ncbi:MAG: 4'-phosphopantetheinyl transferase superfamily protein [Magnetococcus sp. YQC-9]